MAKSLSKILEKKKHANPIYMDKEDAKKSISKISNKKLLSFIKEFDKDADVNDSTTKKHLESVFWAEWDSHHEDGQDNGEIVFRAETRGGKRRVDVTKFKDGTYTIEDFKHGSINAMMDCSNKSVAEFVINQSLDGDAKIDGINYIVKKNTGDIRILDIDKKAAPLTKKEIVEKLSLDVKDLYEEGGQIKKTEDGYEEYLNELSAQTNDPEIKERHPYGTWMRKSAPNAFEIGFRNWSKEYQGGGQIEKTEDEYEEYLNELGTPSADLESEGGRIPDSMPYGTWMRKNDQTAWNVGYQDWSRDDKYAKGGSTSIPAIVMRAMTDRVVDIGQLSDQEIKDLNKYVKKGVLIKGKGGPFPKPKTVYAIKGFDFEKNRTEEVEQILSDIEKLEPGTVIRFDKGGAVDSSRIDTALRQYANTALWSSTYIKDDEDVPMDQDYGYDDISEKTIAWMRKDVEKFFNENIDNIDKSELDDEAVGHNFWLSRNGHGAGFFDAGSGDEFDELQQAAKKYKEVNLEVGDDDKVHALQENFSAGGQPLGSTVGHQSSFAKGGEIIDVFTYYDNIGGRQTQDFSSLEEIKKHIEDFGWHGDSEGVVYKNGRPVLEYISRENDPVVFTDVEFKINGQVTPEMAEKLTDEFWKKYGRDEDDTNQIKIYELYGQYDLYEKYDERSSEIALGSKELYALLSQDDLNGLYNDLKKIFDGDSSFEKGGNVQTDNLRVGVREFLNELDSIGTDLDNEDEATIADARYALDEMLEDKTNLTVTAVKRIVKNVSNIDFSDEVEEETKERLKSAITEMNRVLSGKKAKKQLRISAHVWLTAAEEYLKNAYFLELNDMDLDVDKALTAIQENENPVEYIDAYALKHDLDKNPEYDWKEQKALLKKIGYDEYSEGGILDEEDQTLSDQADEARAKINEIGKELGGKGYAPYISGPYPFAWYYKDENDEPKLVPEKYQSQLSELAEKVQEWDSRLMELEWKSEFESAEGEDDNGEEGEPFATGGVVDNPTYNDKNQKTANGIWFTDDFVGHAGANFIIFPGDNHTKEDIRKAKAWLRDNRDVTSIATAQEEDLDEAYRSAIFRHKKTKPLKWYQVNADDYKVIRKERKAGTSIDDFVEKHVMPHIEETENKNIKKYGEEIRKSSYFEKGGQPLGSNVGHQSSFAWGGVVGEKRAKDIAAYMAKLGVQQKVDLPYLKEFSEKGLVLENFFKILDELHDKVNVEGGIRINYDDSVRLSNYFMEYRLTPTQAELVKIFGPDKMVDKRISFAAGGQPLGSTVDHQSSFAKGGKSEKKLVPGIFEIPGSDPEHDVLRYEGYHDPEIRWNGFATPEFTKDVATKILEEAKYKYRFDGENLFATFEEEDGEQEIPVLKRTIDGKKVNMYGVGSFEWVWEVANTDEKFMVEADDEKYDLDAFLTKYSDELTSEEEADIKNLKPGETLTIESIGMVKVSRLKPDEYAKGGKTKEKVQLGKSLNWWDELAEVSETGAWGEDKEYFTEAFEITKKAGTKKDLAAFREKVIPLFNKPEDQRLRHIGIGIMNDVRAIERSETDYRFNYKTSKGNSFATKGLFDLYRQAYTYGDK